MAKHLQNLFVLNGRVAMLGRWRYGLFSMIPVGATNVGSIKMNGDTVCTLTRPTAAAVRLPPTSATEPSTPPHRPCSEASLYIVAQEWRVLSEVLVFEASETFEFALWPRQEVHVRNRAIMAVGMVKASGYLV